MKRREVNYNDDSDLWESGQLGQSRENTEVQSVDENKAVDDALGLQMISIRLQKKLIEDLKELAKEEGITYQPLMRQILTRYVKSEKRKLSAAARR